MTRTTLQLSTEAQCIVDKIFAKSVNLSPADKDMLSLVLYHAISDLDSAIKDLQNNKVPSALAGIPATLALLSAMVILDHNPEAVDQFKAFIKSLERAT